jgi:hypothetical protein
MSIFLGIVFLLGGLALAVFLGIILYRDPPKYVQPHLERIGDEKSPQAA